MRQMPKRSMHTSAACWTHDAPQHARASVPSFDVGPKSSNERTLVRRESRSTQGSSSSSSSKTKKTNQYTKQGREGRHTTRPVSETERGSHVV